MDQTGDARSGLRQGDDPLARIGQQQIVERAFEGEDRNVRPRGDEIPKLFDDARSRGGRELQRCLDGRDPVLPADEKPGRSIQRPEFPGHAPERRPVALKLLKQLRDTQARHPGVGLRSLGRADRHGRRSETVDVEHPRGRATVARDPAHRAPRGILDGRRGPGPSHLVSNTDPKAGVGKRLGPGAPIPGKRRETVGERGQGLGVGPRREADCHPRSDAGLSQVGQGRVANFTSAGAALTPVQPAARPDRSPGRSSVLESDRRHRPGFIRRAGVMTEWRRG